MDERGSDVHPSDSSDTNSFSGISVIDIDVENEVEVIHIDKAGSEHVHTTFHRDRTLMDIDNVHVPVQENEVEVIHIDKAGTAHVHTPLHRDNEDEANTGSSANIDEPNNPQPATTSLEEEDVSGSLVGIRRNKIENIFKLYCSHARIKGFSVRKGTTRYNTSGKLNEKYFCCSSSGYRDDKKSAANENCSKTVHITRTGCKAMVRAKLQADGSYEIITHVEQHNHQLTRKEWNHLHRSERQITQDKGRAIEDMLSSGLKPTDSYRYMVHDAGGEDCIGHTLRDHMNFVNRLQIKAIEGGDANSLTDLLYEQASQETDFFFRIRHDDEGRLCNVFWRDTMMLEDYNIYGDVVSFDTTYRTNKYNLIYAPFVGLNNHRNNIFFGCAFLADEKTHTFEWLFEVFKKSMGGKDPISIFTDQDLAMGNAIAKVFPQTRHRLCQWHLHQNALSRFGLLRNNNSFKDVFQKCLSGCSDEKEFEDCWASMISKYKLENNSWFARLYELKNKWSTGLNKSFFSAGLLTTQRSESTNSAIGVSATKTTTLTKFYDLFIDTVDRWRKNEMQDEFKCSISIPKTKMQLTGILKHASEVYTLTIFEKFETEFMKCVFTQSTIVSIANAITTYKLSYERERDHWVLFDATTNLLSCTCKKFNEYGILCHHCLRVLLLNNVCEIPQKYILKRWTKMAKSDVWDKFSDRVEENLVGQKGSVPWRHDMARNYYNFLLECEDDEEARKILEEGHKRDVMTIRKKWQEKAPSNASIEGENSSSTHVLDPPRSETKGRRRRLKGHLEKKTKKGKTNIPTSTAPNEFGTKTPNIRLF